jgi:hypothetical protein
MSGPAPSVAADDRRHVEWLRSAVALGLFFGWCHCPRLWTSDRTFPLTPVWESLPPLSPLVNHLWFDALLVLTLALAVFPRQTWLCWVVLVGSGVLSLWDQMRWQPWFYQYWWMLLVLMGMRLRFPPEKWLRRTSGDGDGDGKVAGSEMPISAPRVALNLCLLILATTYFWSGIQKCNPIFLTEVYPWFIAKVLPKLPEWLQTQVKEAAWTVPLMEILLGLGMLFRPTQRLALLGAMVMHLFVLWCLGPWGHEWNTVVWPWNAAMMLCCLILIGPAGRSSIGELLRPQRSVMHAVILILFGVMPLLSFFGLWSKYFSAALYSGNTMQGAVCLSAEDVRRLPAPLNTCVYQMEDGRFYVVCLDWTLKDMNVPPYPEACIYRSAARYIRRLVGPRGSVEAVFVRRYDAQTKTEQREPVPP